jgi:hypothetical protein
MAKWVQHKLGGERYELVERDNHDYAWRARCTAPGYGNYFLYLPKSEYVEVPAPEVWTDITSDCVTCNLYSEPHGSVLENRVYVIARIDRGYRLRKIPICTGDGPGHEPIKQWAFIVEKREGPVTR